MSISFFKLMIIGKQNIILLKFICEEIKIISYCAIHIHTPYFIYIHTHSFTAVSLHLIFIYISHVRTYCRQENPPKKNLIMIMMMTNKINLGSTSGTSASFSTFAVWFSSSGGLRALGTRAWVASAVLTAWTSLVFLLHAPINIASCRRRGSFSYTPDRELSVLYTNYK